MNMIKNLILLALFLAVPNLLAGEVIKVNLSSEGDNIAFEVKEFNVPAGKDIQIEFVNRALKDSEILHNIAILKPGSLSSVLLEFAETYDYNIDALKANNKNIIAITPLLEPGQAGVVKISAGKLEKGKTYPYVCLVAGHGDHLGMKGDMHVGKK